MNKIRKKLKKFKHLQQNPCWFTLKAIKDYETSFGKKEIYSKCKFAFLWVSFFTFRENLNRTFCSVTRSLTQSTCLSSELDICRYFSINSTFYWQFDFWIPITSWVNLFAVNKNLAMIRKCQRKLRWLTSSLTFDARVSQKIKILVSESLGVIMTMKECLVERRV